MPPFEVGVNSNRIVADGVAEIQRIEWRRADAAVPGWKWNGTISSYPASESNER